MRISKSIPRKSEPAFAFVVDGECEFWYFQMMKRNERRIGINLEPRIPQKKKLNEQYEKVIELSNDYDRVFWIVDFDTIMKETREARKGTKTPLQCFKDYCQEIESKYSNVIVIINNPCLEYWHLLHYTTTSKYYDCYDKVKTELIKYLPGYEKTQKYYTQSNDIYKRLKPLLLTAINNSKQIKGFHLDNPCCGTAQMHLFYEAEKDAKKIIELID